MSEQEPVFRLNRENREKVRNGGYVRVGGYGANEPQNTVFEDPEDADKTLEGEQWGIYVPDVLEKVQDPTPVEEASESLAAIAEAAERVPEDEVEVEPEEEPEEDSDDEDTRDHIPNPPSEERLEEITSGGPEQVSEEVEPKDPEELDFHTIDDLDADEVPKPEEIKDHTRSDLKNLATQLGVIDDIEGTGSNGYIQVVDFKNYLVPLLEEYHENADTEPESDDSESEETFDGTPTFNSGSTSEEEDSGSDEDEEGEADDEDEEGDEDDEES